MDQAKAAARSLGRLPMILVPYLNEEQLQKLEQESVSGIDASGNLLVVVPKQVLVCRSGKNNKYPEAALGVNPYAGSYGVVPRALLGQPTFEAVNSLATYLRESGVTVALSTISKALKALDEDLVIRLTTKRGRKKERAGAGIQLVQPGFTLDKLADQASSRIFGRGLAKFSSPGWALPELAALAQRSSIRLVATGETSASRYTPMGWQQPRPEFYCDDIAGLVRASAGKLVDTELFPDLALIETRDPGVYFDSRPDENGVPWAPPLQVYLELYRGGKREKELASDIRANVLRV
jgi:hypothetical protein